MIKTVLLVLLAICVYPVIAQRPEPIPSIPIWPDRDRVDAPTFPQSVSLEDGQVVWNAAILGPTDELLPPYVATKSLRGVNYEEWCLRWNKLQTYLAKQRVIPPKTIRGGVTKHSAYAQGVSGFGRLGGGAFRTQFHSTTRSHEEIWEIGGYGGGPVDLYNPFVQP